MSELWCELGNTLRIELDGIVLARTAKMEARMDTVETSLAKFKCVTGGLGEGVGTCQVTSRAAQNEVAQLGPRLNELELAVAVLNSETTQRVKGQWRSGSRRKYPTPKSQEL